MSDFRRVAVHVAAKYHYCDECQRLIAPGGRYVYMAGTSDCRPGLLEARWHRRCYLENAVRFSDTPYWPVPPQLSDEFVQAVAEREAGLVKIRSELAAKG